MARLAVGSQPVPTQQHRVRFTDPKSDTGFARLYQKIEAEADRIRATKKPRAPRGAIACTEYRTVVPEPLSLLERIGRVFYETADLCNCHM